MLAIAYATGRAYHARQVNGDDPDKNGYPGPPGWGFGVGLTTPHSKKLIVTKVEQKMERYCSTGQSPQRAVVPMEKRRRELFPRKSCRLWDNVEKYGTAGRATDDNITRRKRVACWTNKATDTHWDYETLIAFPLQQWLYERAQMLRCTYIACLVTCIKWGWKHPLMKLKCQSVQVESFRALAPRWRQMN
jgi:hypothetical protein